MTGYDLERWIRASIHYFWPARLSPIYRTLRQLEDEGLVSSEISPQESRPDRRVYSATPAALMAMLQWLNELVTERDAIRVPFLVRFFLSGSRNVDDLLTQLRVLKRLYEQHAAEYEGEIRDNMEHAKAEFPHTELDALVWDATRRAGEMYTEFWQRWLDETIGRLEVYKRKIAEPAPRKKR